MIAAIHGILEQGAFFVPSQISGMIMWYDAAIGVTKDGSNKVSAWVDQIGGNTLIQGNATYQPTHISSSINGLPALRFNGHQLATLSQTIIDREYVIIYKLNGAYSGTYHTLVIQDATPFYQVYIDATRIRGFIDPRNYDSLITPSAIGVNNLLFARLAASGLQFKNNGVTGATIGAAAIPTATAPFKVGSYGVNLNPLNGDIAEILVYNKALSATERASIENYLKTKYGFTY